MLYLQSAHENSMHRDIQNLKNGLNLSNAQRKFYPSELLKYDPDTDNKLPQSSKHKFTLEATTIMIKNLGAVPKIQQKLFNQIDAYPKCTNLHSVSMKHEYHSSVFRYA